MSYAPVLPPAPSTLAGSRLALTVLYALAVHLALALGLHITPPKAPAPAAAPRLEITLVQRPPSATPPRRPITWPKSARTAAATSPSRACRPA
ncbi:hypothetical protein [Immundisolibacter cernigliae]|uniref:Uncharacterized protein n=1 Tax=Immundisolibacter cernigliae TaxID=1810504 RepID=A0A1B1YU71_9GAMM|nr:hypothetical protein [Immundisolibacter cernigliae]ANX04282.1 hypothetical protein PG2T_08910 [Immundisolibacter cernigliae]